jgi:hypothetical protein
MWLRKRIYLELGCVLIAFVPAIRFNDQWYDNVEPNQKMIQIKGQ